jgi:methanethiol S-methyltransferase
MHGEGIPWGYGFWSLVVVNTAIFALLALSYLTPVKRREWRSFGVFTGFVVALFTEMYGFPLTVYILTAVLGSRYPALNPSRTPRAISGSRSLAAACGCPP